jgi:hypothetical protein
MKDKTRKTLKNLLTASIIPLVSFIPIHKANGQIKDINNLNTLHFIFQPEDLGWGLRNDYRISLGQKKGYELSKWGLYSSMSSGNYKFDGGGYIKDHLKLGLGGIFYPKEKPLENSHEFFSFGISYHYHGERDYPPETINEKRFKQLSFDLGIGARRKNFSGFISVDPLKLEFTVGGGLAYNWLSQKETKKNKKLLAEICPQ